jgi:hypothetical protein
MAQKLYTGKPAEPTEPGAVVRFSKFGGYHFAAINIDGLWYLTQGKKGNVSQRSWDDFLDWVGKDDWPTLELLS